ncbi:hypothetical protein F2P81_005600 [Scophthalmus maximus]|uniref:Uncharacterized protein n=1 Tax=Scophthalmus maximus TaxID=52904 RepID=A0A6A4TCE4_SCOMX|nr:hypothetical protein F2P81_005600 [Scophthalmus maximus]
MKLMDPKKCYDLLEDPAASTSLNTITKIAVEKGFGCKTYGNKSITARVRLVNDVEVCMAVVGAAVNDNDGERERYVKVLGRFLEKSQSGTYGTDGTQPGADEKFDPDFIFILHMYVLLFSFVLSHLFIYRKVIVRCNARALLHCAGDTCSIIGLKLAVTAASLLDGAGVSTLDSSLCTDSSRIRSPDTLRQVTRLDADLTANTFARSSCAGCRCPACCDLSTRVW